MVSSVVILLQQLLEALLTFRNPAFLLFTGLYQSLDKHLEHQTQNRVFGGCENLDTSLLDRLDWSPIVVRLGFVRICLRRNLMSTNDSRRDEACTLIYTKNEISNDMLSFFVTSIQCVQSMLIRTPQPHLIYGRQGLWR